jgi:hypothetical protein
MSRGLSDLQQRILQIAARNRLAEFGDAPQRFEVLVCHSSKPPYGPSGVEVEGWPGFHWWMAPWGGRFRILDTTDTYEAADACRRCALEAVPGWYWHSVAIVPPHLLDGIDGNVCWWSYTDAYPTELLSEIYGYSLERQDLDRELPGGLIRYTFAGSRFPAQALGAALKVHKVDISRACVRLRARGLLVESAGHAGACISSAGLEGARALMAHESPVAESRATR